MGDGGRRGAALRLFLATGLLLLLTACGPSISTVEISGDGTIVTITGVSLGDHPVVWVGGKAATVISVQGGSVTVEMPPDVSNRDLVVENDKGDKARSVVPMPAGAVPDQPPVLVGGAEQPEDVSNPDLVLTPDELSLKAFEEAHLKGLTFDRQASADVTGLEEVMGSTGDSKETYNAAEAAVFTNGVRLQYANPNLTYAVITVIGVTDESGTPSVARAWEAWRKTAATAIEGSSHYRHFEGQLDDGAKVSGFTISYYGGVQEAFVIAGDGPLVWEFTLQGSPKFANGSRAVEGLDAARGAALDYATLSNGGG